MAQIILKLLLCVMILACEDVNGRPTSKGIKDGKFFLSSLKFSIRFSPSEINTKTSSVFHRKNKLTFKTQIEGIRFVESHNDLSYEKTVIDLIGRNIFISFLRQRFLQLF